MLVVVLDTATAAVTAALVLVDVNGIGAKGVEVLAERRAVDGRAHGELLAPAIAGVLSDAGATGRDLAAIVAGVGPGPFTGLRVGLATAAAMSQALTVPTYAVCSLDAIGAHTPGTTLVATDARRKEVYWAVYGNGVRLTDPAVDSPAEVARKVAGAGVHLAVGDGALAYANVIGIPVRDEPRYPAASALAELAADRIRSRAASEQLEPLYLRRPDAQVPGPRKAVGR